MLCGLPLTDSEDVLNMAVPELSVPVPSVVAPSLNVTVPVGVPEPGEFAITVAVNVTVWPKTVGLWSDEIVVVVLAVLTVCPPESVAELPLKLLSPP